MYRKLAKLEGVCLKKHKSATDTNVIVQSFDHQQTRKLNWIEVENFYKSFIISMPF